MEFRFAKKQDTPLILFFIRQLAEYEQLLDQVVADEATLEEWIFEKKKAEVIFVLEEGKEVGFALFFHNFSTFLGRAGLYLEDLFVLPEYRGQGIGKALYRMLEDLVNGNCEYITLSTSTKNYQSIFKLYIEELGMCFHSAFLFKETEKKEETLCE